MKKYTFERGAYPNHKTILFIETDNEEIVTLLIDKIDPDYVWVCDTWNNPFSYYKKDKNES